MKNLIILLICFSTNCLIGQNPPVFVPVDYQNVNWNSGPPYSLVGREGHSVLVLRRAYFWANSEPDDCPHGPWAKIYTSTYHSALLELHSLSELQDDPTIIPSFDLGAGTKLPGPIYFADEDCISPGVEDAYSEWVDGPWGRLFSLPRNLSVTFRNQQNLVTPGFYHS